MINPGARVYLVVEGNPSHHADHWQIVLINQQARGYRPVAVPQTTPPPQASPSKPEVHTRELTGQATDE